MTFIEFLQVALRWAWGTLLTAIVTAVLTVFLRHGKRWFRPVQKFIRTGRLGQAHSRQGGGQTRRSVPTAEREPRMTVARVLSTLAQLTGKQAPPLPPPHLGTNGEGDRPLDLKF